MNKKTKLAKLTKFVIFSISVILSYTVMEFLVSSVVGVSHDTLTTCVFAFFGTELCVTALIKIFNILKLGE